MFRTTRHASKSWVTASPKLRTQLPIPSQTQPILKTQPEPRHRRSPPRQSCEIGLRSPCRFALGGGLARHALGPRGIPSRTGREIGGIVFRIDRTSKKYGKYRFFRSEDELLPAHPPIPTESGSVDPKPATSSGMWEEKGKSSYARIGEEKFGKNFEKQKTLNGSLYSDSEVLPKRPTSHNPVFCTSQADLDRIVDDLVLSGTGRFALDLEIYGAAEGDGLDPWLGEVRFSTLSVTRAVPYGCSTSGDPGDRLRSRFSSCHPRALGEK